MRIQLILWSLWGLALFGTLKIAELPLPALHGICGPWGCGPPMEALIACHGAWLLCFIPVNWYGLHNLSLKQSWWFGCSLASIGVIVILAVGLYERFVWFPQANELAHRFFLQRWAFSVATMTDVPLIPATLSGIVVMLFSHYQYFRISDSMPIATQEIIR